MFSKARRFDYYPTPEAKRLPTCIRCVRKHKKCICSSNSKIPIFVKRMKENDSTTVSGNNETMGNSFSSTFTRRFGHNSSADEGFHSSSPQNIPSTAPNSSSSDDQHSDEDLPFSNGTFTRKKQIVQVDVHRSSSEASTSSNDLICAEDEVEYDEVMDQPLQASGLTPPDPTKEELLEYLNGVEKKIDEQRHKIDGLRSQLFSSSSESFASSVRTPSPLELSIQERLKNLEAMSRFCVKETLDFVVMYNKNQEEKCAVRPDDYKDLVEFCSTLIDEMNRTLNKDERKEKKWPKVKNFFRRIARSCGKMFAR